MFDAKFFWKMKPDLSYFFIGHFNNSVCSKSNFSVAKWPNSYSNNHWIFIIALCSCFVLTFEHLAKMLKMLVEMLANMLVWAKHPNNITSLQRISNWYIIKIVKKTYGIKISATKHELIKLMYHCTLARVKNGIILC